MVCISSENTKNCICYEGGKPKTSLPSSLHPAQYVVGNTLQGNYCSSIINRIDSHATRKVAASMSLWFPRAPIMALTNVSHLKTLAAFGKAQLVSHRQKSAGWQSMLLLPAAPFPPHTPSDLLLVYLNDTVVWNDGGFLSSWVMHSLSAVLCLGTFSTSLITNCNKVMLFCNSIAFVKKSQSGVRMWKGTVIYHMPCLTPYYKISFLVPEKHIHVLLIRIAHG